ncbi:MAG: cupredoxin domain-containing protein [Betaproteobacteria bacterium]
MRHLLISSVLGLFLTATAAFADDLPTYKLLMKGGRFIPETIEVPAQTRFRLEVKNEGPGATEFESLELKKELVLAPGVTRSLVFFPMKPGTYKFFDDFHPDTGRGQIVVK